MRGVMDMPRLPSIMRMPTVRTTAFMIVRERPVAGRGSSLLSIAYCVSLEIRFASTNFVGKDDNPTAIYRPMARDQYIDGCLMVARIISSTFVSVFSAQRFSILRANFLNRRQAPETVVKTAKKRTISFTSAMFFKSIIRVYLPCTTISGLRDYLHLMGSISSTDRISSQVIHILLNMTIMLSSLGASHSHIRLPFSLW